jgi:hypothetical protein
MRSDGKACLSTKKTTSMVATPNSMKAKQLRTPLCRRLGEVSKRFEDDGEHELCFISSLYRSR